MIAMELKNYNKTTRFILPYILPDKTLLCEEFGFINAYTKTILKKTTVILVFTFDLNNHWVIHECLEALNNFKGCYQDQSYELFEFEIPNENRIIVNTIVTNNVYGLLSSEKFKILTFWENFKLNHLPELLKDLIELDVLSITSVKDELPFKFDIKNKGIDQFLCLFVFFLKILTIPIEADFQPSNFQTNLAVFWIQNPIFVVWLPYALV